MQVNALTDAAVVLHRAAPIEFKQFVEGLRAHATNLAAETVQADDTQVRLMQGRAREAAVLLRWFDEISQPPKGIRPKPTHDGGSWAT